MPVKVKPDDRLNAQKYSAAIIERQLLWPDKVVDVEHTDSKYGGFIKHEPLEASVSVERKHDEPHIKVEDVFSPTIVQRLNMESGVFRARIDDWRAVVDCILIDTAYDGEVFNVALSDIPEKKADLVQGEYKVPAPAKGSQVAVKIIDMLGEELIVTAEA